MKLGIFSPALDVVSPTVGPVLFCFQKLTATLLAVKVSTGLAKAKLVLMISVNTNVIFFIYDKSFNRTVLLFVGFDRNSDLTGGNISADFGHLLVLWNYPSSGIFHVFVGYGFKKNRHFNIHSDFSNWIIIS